MIELLHEGYIYLTEEFTNQGSEKFNEIKCRLIEEYRLQNQI
jgi:hypothetical protein